MGLFGSRRKGASVPVLRLLDARGREVIRSRIDLFPFQEPVILLASETFFNDPEPCEIHRRALQLRLSSEIREAVPPGTVRAAEELPPEIAGYFAGYEFAAVSVEEE